MRRIVTPLILATLAAACGLSLAQAQPQPQPAPAPGAAQTPPDASSAAPADPGLALINARCSLCHGADLALGAKKPAAAWEDLVRSMMRKGAELSEDEEAQVVAYLSKNNSTPAGN